MIERAEFLLTVIAMRSPQQSTAKKKETRMAEIYSGGGYFWLGIMLLDWMGWRSILCSIFFARTELLNNACMTECRLAWATTKIGLLATLQFPRVFLRASWMDDDNRHAADPRKQKNQPHQKGKKIGWKIGSGSGGQEKIDRVKIYNFARAPLLQHCCTRK